MKKKNIIKSTLLGIGIAGAGLGMKAEGNDSHPCDQGPGLILSWDSQYKKGTMKNPEDGCLYTFQTQDGEFQPNEKVSYIVTGPEKMTIMKTGKVKQASFFAIFRS